MVSLPGTWHCRVSAGTGQPGVSILWLGEMESLVCNFYLSVAAHKIVWADWSLRYSHVAGMFSNQQTQFLIKQNWFLKLQASNYCSSLTYCCEKFLWKICRNVFCIFEFAPVEFEFAAQLSMFHMERRSRHTVIIIIIIINST